MVVLDARILHPVTADRRTEDSLHGQDTVCTHHFVSSWIQHSKELHDLTARRRARGDSIAVVHGQGQRVLRENLWDDDTR